MIACRDPSDPNCDGRHQAVHTPGHARMRCAKQHSIDRNGHGTLFEWEIGRRNVRLVHKVARICPEAFHSSCAIAELTGTNQVRHNSNSIEGQDNGQKTRCKTRKSLRHRDDADRLFATSKG